MNKRKKIIGIIPARYGSSRFPGKPLADIGGMTMIERVYRQCEKATMLDETMVATDDERIERAVLDFGGRVLMTDPDHESGTERCREALALSTAEWDVVINIQGDEPLISPDQIDQLCKCFDDNDVEIATLIKKISDESELHNPNVVKVVSNMKGMAMYFSRSLIPFNRNMQQKSDPAYFKHVGIYGYRSDILKSIASLPAGRLENIESLEQLRWLENGYHIFTAHTAFDNIAVDVPSDIENVMKIIGAQ